MDFLFYQNTIYFLAFALVSGILLAIPSVRKGGFGGQANMLSTKEAVQMANKSAAIFIDIRPAEEYKDGSIPQARNIPMDELEEKTASLSKSKPVILVCNMGRSAQKAAATLKKLNFEEVHVLSGGLSAWKQDGLPLKKHTVANTRKPTR
ncbi:rhodanese-like domain-containing protein [Advenella sp. RU8]|uniref:rhodanese-like domain-containing protein n=1 Tax=Advenella sp. RU8 TaxID=3399575 RepID=UPI003AAC3F1A